MSKPLKIMSMFLLLFISGVYAAPIIIDNEDTQASRSSGWSFATAASNNYGANSRFATVGLPINTYRYTPDILIGGEYNVFAWNSCFNPRATNVPHRIVHAQGQTIVAVDQDCITGSSGEWFPIGSYFFNLGELGYVEISDTGLSSGSYIGADAIMFEPVDESPLPDSISPTAPTNVVANPIAANLISLSWNPATDNVGVVQYDVYRGNSLVTSIASTAYTDSGLSANTLYEYYIIALDAAGNLSNLSSTVSATTLATGSISVITDLFETASLDPKWNLFGEEHLSSTQPPITLINGQLVLHNTSPIPWFNSDRSFLMYVNYVGAFDIRTTVRVRRHSNQAQETTSGFRFGGLMVRNPGIGYKFLVVGRRGSIGNQVETKNTIFPGGGAVGTSSPIGFNTPDGTQSSELRLVRDGITGVITAYSREIGTSEWTQRAFSSNNEPDLGSVGADSVQVGLIVYADNGTPDFVGIFDEIINTVAGTTEFIFENSFE